MPMRLLYTLSDLMYPFVYYLARYRRRVVRENITGSFPGMNISERKKTEKKYYRFLCDLVVETIKAGTITFESLSRRMHIRNPEVVNRFFREGKSVIVLSQHYGNWEWLIHIARYLDQHAFVVYKPLENEIFGNFMNSVRERFGGETISMSLALRKLIESDKSRKPVLMWLAADQAPPWNHPFWTTFLNRETMFFNGPAKLARRFNHPVVLQKIRRIKRGYYESWFEVLTPTPLEMTEEEIITSYVKKAEMMILEDPACYLWSHRRWKYRRPEGVPLS